MSDGGNTVPRIAKAEHIGPDDTGDNINAKRVASYVWNAGTSEWERATASAGGGGTQYNEDAAHSSGATGTVALVVRHDAGGSLSDTDGDYSVLQTDSAGRLRVAVSGAGSGGTSSTDDSAFTAGTDAGTGAMGIYQSSEDSVDDGDIGVLAMTANRHLKVEQQGTVTVDGSGVTQPVSAASLPLPTGAATSAKQDTIIGHLDGVEGLLTTIDADTSILAATDFATEAKQDTGNTSLSSIDGKITAVNTGAVVVSSSALPSGAATAAKQPALGTAGTSSADVITVQGRSGMTPLLTDGSATTQPVSNAGLTELAAAINSSKVDVNIVSSDVASGGTAAADDADFTAGTTLGTPAQGVYESTPTSVTDGDLGTVGITSGRRLKTSATIDAALPTGNNNIGDVDVASSVLPTGASTSAKQDTIIGHVDGIEGLLTTIDADTSILAATDFATEAKQDDIITAIGAIPGGGGTQYSDGDAEADPTGTVSMGTDGTNVFALHTDTAGDLQVDVLSSALPSGAATSAKQDTAQTALDAIKTATETIDNAIAGSEMQVDVVTSALPSGAATSAKQDTIIGHVDGIEGLLTTIDSDTSTLAVVGGGVEATALRVTIANDSTGLVSVDDNGGSLTVDNAGLTELAAAINSSKLDINVVSSDIALGGTSVADDADFTAGTTPGTPSMGVYESTPTSVTDGDLGTVGITAARRLKTSATIDAALPAGNNNIGDVDVASSVLPTGASTSAKQDTIIGHLDGVEGLLTTIDTDTSNISTKIDTIAGAVSGTEVQVDVLTMPTTTVQATNLDIRDLTATDVVTANLSATDNAVLDSIDVSTASKYITGIGHGVTTVTTAGTDVALAASTACKKVTVQAQTDNTGVIAVGASGVDATVATGTGILLFPGDSYEFDIDNLADIFIDSSVNGEGVRYSYFT